MTRTLNLKEPEDKTLSWPHDMRDHLVPDYVYDNLVLESVPEEKVVRVKYNGQVYATVTTEELSSNANIGNLVRHRVRRHYVMKVKPELFIC